MFALVRMYIECIFSLVSIGVATPTVPSVWREVSNYLIVFCTKLDRREGQDSQSQPTRVCVLACMCL